MDNFSFLNAAHSAYFSDLYDQYLDDPDSLEPSWRAFFQGYDFGSKSNFLDDIVDGVGSYANGVSSGMSDNIVGDAFGSSANSLSYNMDVLDRTEDTPA